MTIARVQDKTFTIAGGAGPNSLVLDAGISANSLMVLTYHADGTGTNYEIQDASDITPGTWNEIYSTSGAASKTAMYYSYDAATLEGETTIQVAHAGSVGNNRCYRLTEYSGVQVSSDPLVALGLGQNRYEFVASAASYDLADINAGEGLSVLLSILSTTAQTLTAVGEGFGIVGSAHDDVTRRAYLSDDLGVDAYYVGPSLTLSGTANVDNVLAVFAPAEPATAGTTAVQRQYVQHTGSGLANTIPLTQKASDDPLLVLTYMAEGSSADYGIADASAISPGTWTAVHNENGAGVGKRAMFYAYGSSMAGVEAVTVTHPGSVSGRRIYRIYEYTGIDTSSDPLVALGGGQAHFEQFSGTADHIFTGVNSEAGGVAILQTTYGFVETIDYKYPTWTRIGEDIFDSGVSFVDEEIYEHKPTKDGVLAPQISFASTATMDAILAVFRGGGSAFVQAAGPVNWADNASTANSSYAGGPTEVTEKTSYVTEAVARFTRYYLDAGRLQSIIVPHLREVQKVEAALVDCNRTLSYKLAEGDRLDDFGKIVGEDRQSRSDADYRQAIGARLIINTGGGTVDDLLKVLQLQPQQLDAYVYEYDMAVVVALLTAIDTGLIDETVLLALLREAKMAQVSLNITTYPPAGEAFGFDDATLGFDDADVGFGGTLS